MIENDNRTPKPAESTQNSQGLERPEAVQLHGLIAILNKISLPNKAWEVDRYARHLMTVRRNTGRVPGRAPSTKKAALNQIAAVHMAANALLAALYDLDEPASRAIEGWRVRGEIMQLAIAAANPEGALARNGVRLLSANNKKIPDDVLHKFCVEYALTYRWFSGKPLTMTTNPDSGERSGPYLEFVKDIFKLFEISASPVSQAIKAAKAIRQFNGPAAGQ